MMQLLDHVREFRADEAHLEPEHLTIARAALAREIAGAQKHPGRVIDDASRGPRRRLRRSAKVTIGAAVVALLAGGAAATATAELHWSGWIDNPAGEYHFTLPSGATCTGQAGDVTSKNPEVTKEVEDWFRHTDVMAVADVEAVISQWRKTPVTYMEEDGTVVEVVPGSSHYDADIEYRNAVSDAVQAALDAAMADHGFAGIEYSVKGEGVCSNDDPAGDR
jgi:hypothetical protein